MPLNGGRSLILFDGLSLPECCDNEEVARNVFLLNEKGDIIWRIFSKYDQDGNPFTNIYEKSNQIRAYRWDGGEYLIDIETGEAKPHAFLK